MAGFERKKGDDRGFVTRTISSLAVTRNDLLDYDRTAYKVVASTAASEFRELAGVAVETTTTSDTEIKLQRIILGDEYIAETANNSDVTHNYQRMILSDTNTVNNTGTDDATDEAVFLQTGVVGVNTEKKIRGEFIIGGGEV